MFSYWTKQVLKDEPQQPIRAIFLLFSSCKKPENCCCFQSSILWVELSHLRCLKIWISASQQLSSIQTPGSSAAPAVPSLSEAASLSERLSVRPLVLRPPGYLYRGMCLASDFCDARRPSVSPVTQQDITANISQRVSLRAAERSDHPHDASVLH